MTTKKTREVWAGPGVLSMGRRKIAIGEPIPEELGAEARKSLRSKEKIIDQIIEDTADLKTVAKVAKEAAEDAQKLSDEAMTMLGALTTAVEEARQVASTAKGQNTKAMNAAKAADASDGVKAETTKTAGILAAAEIDLKDAEAAKSEAMAEAEVLAEDVSRTRMEADKAAASAK